MDETRADHIAGVAIIVGPVFADAKVPAKCSSSFCRQRGLAACSWASTMRESFKVTAMMETDFGAEQK